jgi:hypothetical protein
MADTEGMADMERMADTMANTEGMAAVGMGGTLNTQTTMSARTRVTVVMAPGITDVMDLDGSNDDRASDPRRVMHFRARRRILC